MTRKKVKLAFITNDSARKATYKKRKKGLMKKVSELSTLCGIDASAIIYSPYETQPEVWPNNSGAQRVLGQFKRMPEMEQSKKMVNQESFIRQRIGKANEQLKKQCKDNREKEMTEVLYQCLTGKGMHNLIMSDLNDLGWLVDQNLKEIYKRVEVLKKMGLGMETGTGPPPLPPPPQPPQVVGMGGGGFGHEMAGRVGVHGFQEEKLAMNNNNNNNNNNNMGHTQGTDQGIQRMMTTHWFTDWMNNPNDQNMGFGNGAEMIMPFGDNPNPMWSNAFFP